MVLFAQHAPTLSRNTSEWETRCLMLLFQGEVDLFSGEEKEVASIQDCV